MTTKLNLIKELLFIVCFILMMKSNTAQVPSNGLVAEYLFLEGSYEDTNPNSYGPNDARGSFMVSNTVDRFGNANSAKYLLGINYQETEGTYIDLGTSTILKPKEGTISIWLNVEAISTSGWGHSYNPVILAKNTGAPEPPYEAYALYLHMDEGQEHVTVKEPTTGQKVDIDGNLASFKSWHHYAITYNDNTLSYYKDGVLIASKTKNFSSNGIFSGDAVLIGSTMNEINNRALKGSVDDIRIYNRVLSGAEINQLTNESNSVVNYATLRKVVDAGFYAVPTSSDDLYFYYDEKYKSGPLKFKVYNKDRADITSTVTLENIDLLNPTDKRYGTNRYRLTVPNMAGGEFYLLEVTNEKEEKKYLRFTQI